MIISKNFVTSRTWDKKNVLDFEDDLEPAVGINIKFMCFMEHHGISRYSDMFVLYLVMLTYSHSGKQDGLFSFLTCFSFSRLHCFNFVE